MLEEQQEQEQAWQTQYAQRPHRTSPRSNRPQQQYPQPQPQGAYGAAGQEKDTMAEFQEQFSKIAESRDSSFCPMNMGGY